MGSIAGVSSRSEGGLLALAIHNSADGQVGCISNVVLIASPQQLPLEWMPRLLAGGPHPAKVVTGRELRDWVAGAPIATDATATGSPAPSKDVFRIGRD